jgi:hypothetical protein
MFSPNPKITAAVIRAGSFAEDIEDTRRVGKRKIETPRKSANAK